MNIREFSDRVLAAAKAAGIDPAEIRTKAEAIMKAALADPCCATNPVPVTEEMVRAVLREVTGRG